MKKLLAVVGVLIIVASGLLTYVNMSKTVITSEMETSTSAMAEEKPGVYQAVGTVNVSIQ